jgi:hypothetical protein
VPSSIPEDPCEDPVDVGVEGRLTCSFREQDPGDSRPWSPLTFARQLLCPVPWIERGMVEGVWKVDRLMRKLVAWSGATSLASTTDDGFYLFWWRPRDAANVSAAGKVND